MLSTFYTVTINGISGSGDAAGFVDNQTVEKYMANNGNTPPTDLPTSTNKVRANIRYKNIIEKLQSMGNVYVSNTNAVGGTVSAAPSSFVLTLEFERGDEVLTTLDETNNNAVLTGTDAITRCIARGLAESRLNYTYSVYDPTLTSAPQNNGYANALARHGSYVTTFNANALVSTLSDGANAVTVTKLF